MTAADKIAKAPKRIWLDSDSFNGSVGFVHPKAHAKAHWPAYVRADLADALAQENARLRKALEWYAEQFCELDRSHECCGRMTEFDCSGCRARAALGETP